jgi:sugar transferase (PEP-CTERM/EpsH1 system associated)
MSNQPIRVVHLVRALDVGGLEQVVLDLVANRSSAIDASVLCLENRGEIAERFESIGVRVSALELRGATMTRRIWKLARALRTLRPEVVHTHNSGPHVNGAIASKLARVPVLVHTKHGRNYVNDRKKLWQNRLASHLSSKVVAVSHDAAAVARELEQVPEQRIEVIHNGIDYEQFSINPMPFGQAKQYRAVHVARLNRVKDQATLLRAVRIVVDHLPGFELDVIGDGPAREEVAALRAELGLQKQVHLHGARNDVANWLQKSDLFLLSSVSEGICLTLLEAMAAGLPIVATDVGGNREIVEEGKTGSLVPPQDPQAMAAAIVEMCRNVDSAREMGRRGRERVESRFAVKSMVARYETLYRELLVRCVAAPSLKTDDAGGLRPKRVAAGNESASTSP